MWFFLWLLEQTVIFALYVIKIWGVVVKALRY